MPTPAQTEAIKKTNASEAIATAQAIIDELLKADQYKQYVQQHKLSLLDSRFTDLDRLLDLGILKTN